jgi:hypothetical protein
MSADTRTDDYQIVVKLFAHVAISSLMLTLYFDSDRSPL